MFGWNVIQNSVQLCAQEAPIPPFDRVCFIETLFLLPLAVDCEPKDRRFVPLGASTDLPAADPCAFTKVLAWSRLEGNGSAVR
jgi:hypothetical protein